MSEYPHKISKVYMYKHQLTLVSSRAFTPIAYCLHYETFIGYTAWPWQYMTVSYIQVGTELGQAQLKLGLDFTLVFCTIKIWPAMVEISPKI